MESFAKARDAAVPDALGAAWDRVVEAWEEPARHDEVMRLVAQHDAYAWAATRYRTRAGDPIADKQFERVRKAAEVTLMSSAVTRKESSKNPYRSTTTLLVLLVVMIAAGFLYAMVMRARGAEPTPPTGPPMTETGPG
jgi:hypothetical protein